MQRLTKKSGFDSRDCQPIYCRVHGMQLRPVSQISAHLYIFFSVSTASQFYGPIQNQLYSSFISYFKTSQRSFTTRLQFLVCLVRFAFVRTFDCSSKTLGSHFKFKK